MIKRTDKTVITCAITGSVTTIEQTPYLPVTPEEISTSALEAAEAGAAVVHIHVRDPITAKPSMEVDLYRDTVDRIKKRNNKVLINLTTGTGAYFELDISKVSDTCSNTISLNKNTTALYDPTFRVKHVLDIKPDICSLDFNTMNQAVDGIRLNDKRIIKHMLELVQSVGTKPELEIFGSGDLMLAREYIDRGYVKGNPLWQFVLGVKYGFEPTIESLRYVQSSMKEGNTWSAFGISKEEMPIVASAWLHGGHVRVGMEDNIYLEKGVLAETNADLVKKAARIVKDLGGSIASFDEAREIYLS